jgi:hypothetical protein
MPNVLVPLPQPDIPVQCVKTKQSAAPCNPLSMLLGIFPMPSLEVEMAEIVHHKQEAAFGKKISS